jgi:carbon-monoxide dehydrogenase medium subunit
MIPASFEYHQPKDLAEALDLLERYGDEAKIVSGGHSLIPTMKVRMSQPAHLIDIGRIAGIKGVAVEPAYLRVGAATTHWEVESSAVVKSVIPVLSEVASVIADPMVRNRGTMGGSISNADPAADYPASVLAFEADLVCASRDGDRIVNALDWFQGLFTTALGGNEILREIRFPLPKPRTAAAYLKYPHPASRFAVVGVMAILTLDGEGRCADVRVGITGAGTRAVRASLVEQELRGRELDPALIEAASRRAPETLEINEDMHFSAEDRRDLAIVHTKRALLEALDRARNGRFLAGAEKQARS